MSKMSDDRFILYIGNSLSWILSQFQRSFSSEFSSSLAKKLILIFTETVAKENFSENCENREKSKMIWVNDQLRDLLVRAFIEDVACGISQKTSRQGRTRSFWRLLIFKRFIDDLKQHKTKRDSAWQSVNKTAGDFNRGKKWFFTKFRLKN